jgi:hypothetical protein
MNQQTPAIVMMTGVNLLILLILPLIAVQPLP